jgi:GrpB-like predicted nucleotidyltransferase (UPF0157 family)
MLREVSAPRQPESLIPPVMVNGPVVLADPDPGWASRYAREEDRIRSAPGERVVQVQHVGSTSVPDLAEPVIDIVRVVLDSADEAAHVLDLTAAGYRL